MPTKRSQPEHELADKKSPARRSGKARRWREVTRARRPGSENFPGAESALFLVDVQNDFCPGGALPVPDGDRIIPILNRMIQRFKSKNRLVYASRDWHPPDSTHFREFGGRWPVHCVAGTPGANLHPDLRVPPDTIIISKGQGRNDSGYSPFDGTTNDGRRLADDLRQRGISELYVGGLATDYCVRATVLDARRAGFQVTVLTDGIAGIGSEDSRRALEEMREAGALLVPSMQISKVHRKDRG